jgi:hypothetical protein
LVHGTIYFSCIEFTAYLVTDDKKFILTDDLIYFTNLKPNGTHNQNTKSTSFLLIKEALRETIALKFIEIAFPGVRIKNSNDFRQVYTINNLGSTRVQHYYDSVIVCVGTEF